MRGRGARSDTRKLKTKPGEGSRGDLLTWSKKNAPKKRPITSSSAIMKTSTPRASPESSARDPQDVIRNPENVPKKFASLRRLSLRKTNKSLNTGAAIERRGEESDRRTPERKSVFVWRDHDFKFILSDYISPRRLRFIFFINVSDSTTTNVPTMTERKSAFH